MKRAITLWLAIPALAVIVACHSQVHAEFRPTQQQSPSPSPQDVASLCDSIKDIEELPFKDDRPVADPAYNALAAVGEDAIPCLIRKITDETVMKDPRQAPKVGNLAVGDTAFFVLTRVAKIDQAGFVELLPPEVRKAYEGGEGINGYFRYNRRKQQPQETARRSREMVREQIRPQSAVMELPQRRQ
ncbi:MAG TPA: hypothetical protein VFR51_09225 [Pyrinomonadaceae bacterium]|nr:hypothetical protein [Pyrinomonadaceae bacterium]